VEETEEIDWEARVALAPRQLSVSLSHDATLKETILGAIRGLGGCKHKVCDETTLGPLVSHLIVGEDSPPKRTLKLLFAMAKGVPVVKSSWILESVCENRWVEWEPHFAYPVSRCARGQLDGVRIYLACTGSLDKASLSRLVLAAGGTVVSHRQATHVLNGQPYGDDGSSQTISMEWLFQRIMSAGTLGSASQASAAAASHGAAAEPEEDSDSEEF